MKSQISNLKSQIFWPCASTFWPCASTFDFDRDTFAFPNELVWEYRAADPSGRLVSVRREPRPHYTHRCFVLARAVRQFHYRAAFDPAAPPATEGFLRRQIRCILRTNVYEASPAQARILIPGFDGLRSFSARHEALLKEECGGAWRSYVLRSHWRAVLPISRHHQAVTAARMAQSLRAGRVAIVHLIRFPQLSINHGIVLFAVEETKIHDPSSVISDGLLVFSAYDPNEPRHPVEVTFDPRTRTFFLPPNHYWPGGRVDLMEVYRNWYF